MKHRFSINRLTLAFASLLLLVILLPSCVGDAKESIQERNSKILLYEKDGCKVYRFKDGYKVYRSKDGTRYVLRYQCELPIHGKSDGWASNAKKMKSLTSHIELFAFQCPPSKPCGLLHGAAPCAQRSVPDLNLIHANNFMLKVLRKNNFSSNHNTSI